MVASHTFIYILFLPLYYCSPFLTRISVLPLHDSCFPNSYCSVFTWKKSSDFSLSCCWAVSQQILDVFSAQQLQLEGSVLLVIISADVCLAGGKLLCSAVAVDQLMCGNFIRLVKLIRPPPEVWEQSSLGPVVLNADCGCLITIT